MAIIGLSLAKVCIVGENLLPKRLSKDTASEPIAQKSISVRVMMTLLHGGLPPRNDHLFASKQAPQEILSISWTQRYY